MRSGHKAFSPKDMMVQLKHEAATQAAVASALIIHAGDAKAAAIAITAALQDVFGVKLERTSTRGTANTFNT